MAKGPENYNHKKVKRAMKRGIEISAAKWYKVIQEIDMTKSRSKKMTANCDSHCKIRGIAVLDCVHFYQSGGWDMSMAVPTNVIADPKFTPDAVYISGSGHYPSMAHYDGEWWIVYGIIRRKINDHSTKVYVLHNPRCIIEKGYLDDLKDNFFPKILAKQIEE
jgi:hypothetical protein